jgi:hypothetical protein
VDNFVEIRAAPRSRALKINGLALRREKNACREGKENQALSNATGFVAKGAATAPPPAVLCA